MAAGSVIWLTEAMTSPAPPRRGGGVGHRAGGVDPRPAPPPLQDRDDEPFVLLRQLTGMVACALLDDLDLYPERRARARHTTADAGALVGPEHGRGGAAAEPTDAFDAGDDAVGGVAVLEPWGDKQSAVTAAARRVDRGPAGLVELDRHDHAGEDDDVGNEENRETSGGHVSHPFRRLERCRL